MGHRLSRIWRLRALRATTLPALAAAIVVAAAGCDLDDPVAPQPPSATDPAPPASGSVLGVVEVTITGLGTGEATASALSAPDLATLDRLRTARGVRARVDATSDGGGQASADGSTHSGAHRGSTPQALDPPDHSDATGDGTIQIEPLSTGSFTHGERGTADGVRYLNATFRVRNAQSDGSPYDTPRHNLTFLAVDTDETHGETAIKALTTFGGTEITGPDAAALSRTLLPTGAVERNVRGELAPDDGDVLQVVTEAEAGAIDLTGQPAVNTVFPYGFVTRCVSSCAAGGRTLADAPAPDQFDGLVTFAFQVPLQATAADDPFEIRMLFLAVDDTETRVTESPVEQGTTNVVDGADALGGAAVVTLLGNSSTVVSGHGIRRVCRVRTAGADPAAPEATLVDAGAPCAEGAVTIPDDVIVVDDDASAAGDGRAWSTAFRHLQDALACVRDDVDTGGACEGVDEIWVAEGVYHPDEGTGQTDDATNSRFVPVESVGLYGGFAGNEYAREQRDWTANSSVLDGDVDQSGSGDVPVVLYMHATGGARITRATVVDGFTIRNATDGAVQCMPDGAGSECSPTLRNLVVANNFGGMWIVAGGGATASPLLENVSFTGNHQYPAAGGLHLHAEDAGEVSAVLVRSTFDQNSANQYGGAVLASQESGGTTDARFYDTVFRNSLSGFGAAVSVMGGTLHFTNSEFWSNTTHSSPSSLKGAAIYADGADSHIVLTNVTIGGNTAADAGGAVYQTAGSLNIANTIIWDNSPNSLELGAGVTGTVRHSVVEGGCPGPLTCTGVFDADPMFMDMAGGDLRPGASSPAVDAGSNTLLPPDVVDLDGDGDSAEILPLDLARRPRIVDWAGDDADATVDMGAYERQ